MKRVFLIAGILFVSSALQAQEKGRVVEEIVARVNNEIITLSDFERASGSLEEEARQDCPACTPDKIQETVRTRRTNLLRDLIDQSLLAQKGKDLGLNVEADVVRRLDELRQQYNWKDLDDMESQLRAQGISLEDYKQTLRNSFLTQEVVRREVGSHIQVSREDIDKYYQEHQADFNRAENVVLSEFFLSTEKKAESDIPEIEAKINAYLVRIRKGDSFEEIAKRYSEGSTAKEGGYLGPFEHGQLASQFEEVLFKMKKGDISDVFRTKTGFLFFLVMQHYDAGVQPLEKVRNEIENKIAYSRTQPELRKYLANLREESYVLVKPGYTDSAAVAGNPIVEVDPAAEPSNSDKTPAKKKKKANPDNANQ